MQTSIGKRGQVTIPKAIRESLGLQPGMQLDISEEGGVVVLRKPGLGAAVDKWGETAENPYGSTDAFLHELRDTESAE